MATSDAASEAAAAAAAAGCYLLTGGADASIKCWTLADWLPSPVGQAAAAACPASAAGAEFFTLQGLPPNPDAAAVGQGQIYELQAVQHGTQQAQHEGQAVQQLQEQQQQQQQQQQDGSPAAARDSRAEWARCLALASDAGCTSTSGSDGSSSGSRSSQRWRRRWLYVATNRGLVHRVQLPGGISTSNLANRCKGPVTPLAVAAWIWHGQLKLQAHCTPLVHPLRAADAQQGLSERWQCIHKASAAGDARPYLALRLLRQTAGTGGQLGGRSSSSTTWLALSDLAGTVTILADQASGDSSSSSAGGQSGRAGTVCVAQWRPYSSCSGPAGVWWGSSGSGTSSSSDGNGAAGLGSHFCFTTGGKQLLTAWLLPPLSSAGAAEPLRLAEVQLPFAGYANAVSAVLLPPLQPGHPAAAAVVAVGDSTGSVTVLLLTLPSGLQQQPVQASSSTAAPNGTATAPAHQAALPGSGGSGARLVQLAAARRVHAGTPVRALQLRLPVLGTQAGLHQQLAAAEVVTAGGDGAVHTLRLPVAAVAAALGALAADTSAAEQALSLLHLRENGRQAAANDGPAAAPAAPPPAAEGERAAAEQCALPRLLAAASRRYEAVTHIEGILPAPAGASDSSSSDSGGGSSSCSSAGSVVYGFHASHFAVRDEAADAEVAQVGKGSWWLLLQAALRQHSPCQIVASKAFRSDLLRLQVPCGGWRRPSAADVAAADDLAFCVLHDGRLWLYR